MHVIRTALWLAAAATIACSSDPEPVAPKPPSSPFAIVPVGAAPERRFAFNTVDGKLVNQGNFRGRMTVVALAATYDTASLAQVRFLETLVRTHTPRINALLLLLDPPENRPLVDAFAASLDVSFPVAVADEATRAGKGAFPGLHHVPSVVILDRQSREVWRKLGLSDGRELASALNAHD